jgi:voltage-gated potassium channel
VAHDVTRFCGGAQTGRFYLVSPPSLPELDDDLRRYLVDLRPIAISVARIVLLVVVVLGAYALVPVYDLGDLSVLALLGLGLLVLTVLLVWRVQSIVRADYPGLRAIESLVLIATLFMVVFSIAYLSLSKATPASFSEELDRVSAFYYAVSVLSTVGFGDISAKTDTARAVVTLQMLLDLTLVVIIARVILGAARTGLRRGQGASTR